MESTALSLEVHDHQIKHSQHQVGVPKLPSFLGLLLWGAGGNTVSTCECGERFSGQGKRHDRDSNVG